MSTTGLIFDIKRFAVHDGPGIRTTLFLKGCGLKCNWCHNPESLSGKVQLAYYSHKCIDCGECISVCKQDAHCFNDDKHIFQRDKCMLCGECESVCLGKALKLYGKEMTVDEALQYALEDQLFYQESGGGVTLSGGEPLIQSQFCYELLTALKRQGIHTAVDTCGFVSWDSIERVLPVTDIFLYDFKHSDNELHLAHTGGPNRIILENLSKLLQYNKPIEIRIPLIQEFNLDEESIKSIGRMLSKLSNSLTVKLLPYHDLARSKYKALGLVDTMPKVDAPNQEEVDIAADWLREFRLEIKH